MSINDTDSQRSWSMMSHAHIRHVENVVKGLDAYIERSRTLGLKGIDIGLLELKRDGEIWVKLLDRISIASSSEFAVTADCAVTMVDVMNEMSHEEEELFLVQVEVVSDTYRQYFVEQHKEDWNRMNGDEKEISLLSATLRTWEERIKEYKAQVERGTAV